MGIYPFMTKITILAEKISGGRWDVFTDAFNRLNTATPVPIEQKTLNKALKAASVRNPEQLPNLLKTTEAKKYLCICFDLTEHGQRLSFCGSDVPHKIKDPSHPT